MIQVSDFIAMFAPSSPKDIILIFKRRAFLCPIGSIVSKDIRLSIPIREYPFFIDCILVLWRDIGRRQPFLYFNYILVYAKEQCNLQCGEQQYPYGNVGTRNVHITHLIPDIRNPYSPVARSPHTVQKEPGDGSIQHHRALHHHERAYHRTAYR